MAKQDKPKTEQKMPILVRYLISNIEKGVYPTEEELSEIQDKVGVRFIKPINVALLNQIKKGGAVQPVAQNAPERAPIADTGLEYSGPPKNTNQEPPKAKRQKIDENTQIRPGDLQGGRKSVLSNG